MLFSLSVLRSFLDFSLQISFLFSFIAGTAWVVMAGRAWTAVTWRIWYWTMSSLIVAFLLVSTSWVISVFLFFFPLSVAFRWTVWSSFLSFLFLNLSRVLPFPFFLFVFVVSLLLFYFLWWFPFDFLLNFLLDFLFDYRLLFKCFRFLPFLLIASLFDFSRTWIHCTFTSKVSDFIANMASSISWLVIWEVSWKWSFSFSLNS